MSRRKKWRLLPIVRTLAGQLLASAFLLAIGALYVWIGMSLETAGHAWGFLVSLFGALKTAWLLDDVWRG